MQRGTVARVARASIVRAALASNQRGDLVRWHGNGPAGESDTLTLVAVTKNRDECEASRTQVAVGPLREWPRDFSESFRAMPSDCLLYTSVSSAIGSTSRSLSGAVQSDIFVIEAPMSS